MAYVKSNEGKTTALNELVVKLSESTLKHDGEIADLKRGQQDLKEEFDNFKKNIDSMIERKIIESAKKSVSK